MALFERRPPQSNEGITGKLAHRHRAMSDAGARVEAGYEPESGDCTNCASLAIYGTW